MAAPGPHAKKTTSNHTRKKSAGSSTTDPARPKRPTTTLSRRTTPVAPAKLVAKLPRDTRPREPQRPGASSQPEHEWTDISSVPVEEAEEEVERESFFPQFCMACEKEFVPYDRTHLYCSESCRRDDESASNSPAEYRPAETVAVTAAVTSATAAATAATAAASPARLSHTRIDLPPRDIVPRAAPSRPSSLYIDTSAPSPPLSLDDHDCHHSFHHHLGHHRHHHHQQAPPSSPISSFSSAISALRALAHPPSPPSPPSPALWPFSGGGRATVSQAPTPTTTPSRHRHRHSGGWFSAAMDRSSCYTGPSVYDLHCHSSATTTTSATSAAAAALDRPLAPRKPGASARPKSIELVTPLGRYDL